MELGELIINTLKAEVTPAVGCTEPVAVALACAKAKELMGGEEVTEVKILVSPNIYKNGLSVGIPNTGEVGLSIAAALGLVGGQSEKGLKVLENVTENQLADAHKLLANNKISLEIANTDEKVYVEVQAKSMTGDAKAIIKNKHNHFSYLEQQGKVLLDEGEEAASTSTGENLLYSLTIDEIIKAVEALPFESVAFMLEGLEMNEKAAKVGLDGKAGLGVGYSLNENIKKGILSDDLGNQAMILTAAASDARMSGISIPVMSSNGSGNNGLTAILPIAAYKSQVPVDNEKLAKALAISHLVNSYIKHFIGRLSALCGCAVAAGTGAGVAIAWLMGANQEQITGVIKNMLASTSGMICDGAKVGCSLKLATSASTAVHSALLAMSGSVVPARNGIIAETAEETIRNIGILSMAGMSIVDVVILKTMREMQN